LAPEDTASGVMAASEGKYFHAPELLEIVERVVELRTQ
jgi:hypothetical protein